MSTYKKNGFLYLEQLKESINQLGQNNLGEIHLNWIQENTKTLERDATLLDVDLYPHPEENCGHISIHTSTFIFHLVGFHQEESSTWVKIRY